jgi:hypothetical protein
VEIAELLRKPKGALQPLEPFGSWEIASKQTLTGRAKFGLIFKRIMEQRVVLKSFQVAQVSLISKDTPEVVKLPGLLLWHRADNRPVSLVP